MNRLERSEDCDWMVTCLALKKDILTSNLAVPELVEVVPIVVRAWPLIETYLIETGRRGNCDYFGERSSSVLFLVVFWTRVQCIFDV